MKVDVKRKSFGTAHVLGAIHFDVPNAEAIALTGPSGIGKSTLLRMIAGLDTDFEGEIAGVGRLGFVFQEPTLMPWRSALDNIILAADVPFAEASDLLASVGLADKADLYPTQLSLGQRRRIAIVRAFARRPETLLMDEPFASLDGDVASAMKRMLKDLLADRPTRLIFVTHDEADAAELANRLIRIDGAPATIVAQSLVKN